MGVNWLGSEVDHLPPSSAKVKNKWDIFCKYSKMWEVSLSTVLQ
jgi:hypothetical protein